MPAAPLARPLRFSLTWQRSSAADRVWRGVLVAFGLSIPLLLLGIAGALVRGAWPGVQRFGGGFLTGASRNLERIAELAPNVAEDVVFLVEGRNITHGLLRAEPG